MRKTAFFTVFLLVMAAFPFTVNAQEPNIYIEGTATLAEHRTFFMDIFRVEAEGLGFSVAATRAGAEHTFRFDVGPYDQARHIIRISLVSNDTNASLVSFSRVFTTLEEMYDFNQLLFFQATVLIPRPREVQTIIETVHETQTIIETVTAPENDDWRNKLLYVRASINYPVTFYELKGDGLRGGIGVYGETPNRVAPIDNKINALPGVTVGLEVQLFNWLSIEPNFQVSLGDTVDNYFLNMAAGAELKFPIKAFQNFVISPYAAFSYALTTSSVFSDFPLMAAGGGIQIGVKGTENGVFFVDINYMMSLDDAFMKNPYGRLYPEPAEIRYGRFVVGFGIGYKFGFIDR